MNDLVISDQHEEFLLPHIECKYETGKCTISGESYVEDTQVFFAPVFAWIEQFMKTGRPLSLIIKLKYFDTKTSGTLSQLMLLLYKYEQEGKKVDVKWFYEQDNLEMEEEIEDFMASSGLKIQMVPYR